MLRAAPIVIVLACREPSGDDAQRHECRQRRDEAPSAKNRSSAHDNDDGPWPDNARASPRRRAPRRARRRFEKARGRRA